MKTMATSKAKPSAAARKTGPKGDGKRTHKVADAVRGELMSMLLSGAVHDPSVNNVVVSGVELTDDLRIAKVFVRLLDANADDKAQKALLKGLDRARGFLRREVAQRVNLRYAPELRFFWDDSIDRGRDMEALLREIKTSDDGGQSS
jgi:ribosome-binding factor A